MRRSTSRSGGSATGLARKAGANTDINSDGELLASSQRLKALIRALIGKNHLHQNQ